MKHLLTALATLLVSSFSIAQETSKTKLVTSSPDNPSETRENNTAVAVTGENGTEKSQPGFNNYVIKTKTIFNPPKNNLRKAISVACDCNLDEATTAGNSTTNAIVVGGLTVNMAGVSNPEFLLYSTVQGKNVFEVNDGGAAIFNNYIDEPAFRINTDVDNTVLIVNGISGHNANLQEWQTNGSAKVMITGNGDIGIGTAPATDMALQVLKNANATTGIRFENSNTGANAFAALQFGQDFDGPYNFANLGFANPNITSTGVYKAAGTFLLNNGAGGLSLGAVDANSDIRFFAGDWQNAGHRMVIKGSNGFIGMGNTSPGSLVDIGSATKHSMAFPDANINGFQVRSLSANTGTVMAGSHFYMEANASGTGSIIGAESIGQSTNASGTLANSIGIEGKANHSGAGTVTNGRGLSGVVYLNGSGTVTHGAAVAATFARSGSGTIQNGYGFYMGDFPSSGITNKFGVYINDDDAHNYFAGSVGVGVDMGDVSYLSGYKLAVKGYIKAQKLTITQTGWPDYVFDKKYDLLPLKELERFILVNKRLPGVPSAAEVDKEGLDVGETQAILLKKVEELTLYLIQQNREILELQQEITQLKKKKTK